MSNPAGFVLLPRHSLRLVHPCPLRHTNTLPSRGYKLDSRVLRHANPAFVKSRNAHSNNAPTFTSPSEPRAARGYDGSPQGGQEPSLADVVELDGSTTIENDIKAWHLRQEKRSPEAIFGSKHIGQSRIPYELEKAITGVLNDSDRYLLRSDAKRLFLKPSDRGSDFGNEWTTEMPNKFKQSRKRKSARLTPREALAYAVISIPAQYACIRNVLRETSLRLGAAWARNIRGVVDFGSGTGVAMWASFAEFQSDLTKDGNHIVEQSNTMGTTTNGNIGSTALSQSSLKHYLLLENRRALSTISKNLTRGLSLGSTKVHLEDFWGKDGREFLVPPRNTIAIMAFTLTDLVTDLARKQMLRELWNTKAETMIIIDHASDAGFAQVAAAREYLLAKGRRPAPPEPSEGNRVDGVKSLPETSFTPGSHVVAPCPHDGACPLSVSSAGASSSAPAHICSFSQRLERPEFLRKTKHASRGHESIEYSYVVIRRGTRPRPPADTALWDAVPLGILKQRRLKRAKILEVEVTDGQRARTKDRPSEIALEFHERSETPAEVRRRSRHWISDAPPRAADDIRAESYHWPRILQPPLKRSGHVLLETCTKEGNIARHIIPRSQGKQHYYDARKAKWGDSFPWESKNGPDMRKEGRAYTGTVVAGRHAGAGEEPSDNTLLQDIEGEWEVCIS